LVLQEVRWRFSSFEELSEFRLEVVDAVFQLLGDEVGGRCPSASGIQVGVVFIAVGPSIDESVE